MPKTKAKKGSKKPKRKAATKRASASKNGKKTTRQATQAGKASKQGAKTKAAANGRAPTKAPARKATQSARSAPPKDKRQLVQERKILRSEFRWLQKALFALSKADDDQQKLAEVRGDRHKAMPVRLNGSTHELGAVTDSLRSSVMERLEGLRTTLRDEHSLLG